MIASVTGERPPATGRLHGLPGTFVVIAAMLLPAAAAAQVCTPPTEHGDAVTAAAVAGITPLPIAPGASVHLRAGRIQSAAEYVRRDAGAREHSRWAASAAWVFRDIRTPAAPDRSAIGHWCITFSVRGGHEDGRARYVAPEENTRTDELVVGGGIGLGKQLLRLGSGVVSGYGAPQLWLVRTDAPGGSADPGSQLRLDLGTEVGLTYQWRSLQLGLASLTAWRAEVHRT